MEEFISYFKDKKNLTNLLLLGIMALAIPVGVNLARQEQILRSRATTPPIVFSGDNVQQKDGKWTVLDVSKPITLELTGQSDQAGNSSNGGSSNLATPNPSVVPAGSVVACNGEVKTWAQIDSELGPPPGANYPGPFDHSQKELDAYKNAACPGQSVNAGNILMSLVPKSLVGTAYADDQCPDDVTYCDSNSHTLIHKTGGVFRNGACDYAFVDTHTPCGGDSCPTQDCEYNQQVSTSSCASGLVNCKGHNEGGQCAYKNCLNTGGGPGGCNCVPVSSGCPSGQDQIGDGTRDNIKNGNYRVNDNIVGSNLQSYVPGSGQCGYKYYHYESTLLNADICVTYVFGAWADQNACPKQCVNTVTSKQTPDMGAACATCIANNSSGLVASIKNANTTFNSCSDLQLLNYWCNGGISTDAKTQCQNTKNGVCAQQCGGSTSPSPTPAGGTVTTVSFKVAENPDELAAAEEHSYTGSPTTFDTFTFKDKTPGNRFVWVEFKYSNGKTSRHNAPIRLLGGAPTITSCSLTFEGTTTVLNLTGQNFGATKGTLKSNDSFLQISQWKNDSVKATFGNAPTGEALPISLTNADGQTGEGQCSAVSQLSLGAKVFCRAPSDHAVENVDLVLVDQTSGSKPIKQKVRINQDGIIENLNVKLAEGQKYKISLKAPKSLRKTTEFTAGSGTTIIPNFILPVGDIFPAGSGDGVINALDKAELNRQWIISQSASGRSGDFNQDDRVNAIDWACMRYDFGDSDQAELTAP